MTFKDVLDVDPSLKCTNCGHLGLQIRGNGWYICPKCSANRQPDPTEAQKTDLAVKRMSDWAGKRFLLMLENPVIWGGWHSVEDSSILLLEADAVVRGSEDVQIIRAWVIGCRKARGESNSASLSHTAKDLAEFARQMKVAMKRARDVLELPPWENL